MSDLFDPDELADMRADLGDLLVDTCQVMRNAGTRDSGGDFDDNYVAQGAPVPCRTWNAQSPSDLQNADQGDEETPVVTWRVLLPFGADVRGGERLVVRPAQGAPMTMEVAAPDAGASDQLGVLCLCRQVG